MFNNFKSAIGVTFGCVYAIWLLFWGILSIVAFVTGDTVVAMQLLMIFLGSWALPFAVNEVYRRMQ